MIPARSIPGCCARPASQRAGGVSGELYQLVDPGRVETKEMYYMYIRMEWPFGVPPVVILTSSQDMAPSGLLSPSMVNVLPVPVWPYLYGIYNGHSLLCSHQLGDHLRKNCAIISLQDLFYDWTHHFFIHHDLSR